MPPEVISSRDITGLLVDWSAGNEGALQALLPLVYDELRLMANRHLIHERPAHTLQRTALVHEAFLRLIDQQQVNMHCRAQFFALASQVMRNILVDHARKHRSQKRGGEAQRVSLEPGGEFEAEAAGLQPEPVDLSDIDRALKRLEQLDPRLGKIVELRFFGSLNVEDTASVLGISAATVKRDWMSARAWLQREIGNDGKR